MQRFVLKGQTGLPGELKGMEKFPARRGHLFVMKKTRGFILCVAFLGVFLSGFYLSRFLASTSKGAAERPILYYVDPMNPSHTSDRPGLAPCGMKMEPVYAEKGPEAQQNGHPLDLRESGMAPGSVRIGPEKQQAIGVQMQEAQIVSESIVLRTAGRVAVHENRISKVVAAREGYMEDIQTAVPTGTKVQKGQLLASYYSVDSLPTQQAYIYALNAIEQGQRDEVFAGQLGASRKEQLRQAEDNLKLYGIEEAQIRDIARTRQVTSIIELRAPLSGYVIARNIFPYSRFQKDTEFFRIVDLSEVWIDADVYRNEEKYIEPGSPARVSLPGRDTVFTARVSDTLRPFNIQSRTYKVRLEVENPESVLRPDALVDVEFAVQLPPALTVPAEAVFDSGLRKVVFVRHEGDVFEPRRIETGWSFGDRIEIRKGLAAGERIVAAAGFLIDSESRMKLAAAGVQTQTAVCPVCGMDVDVAGAEAAGAISEVEGNKLSFCSSACKEEFDAHAGHALNQPKQE